MEKPQTVTVTGGLSQAETALTDLAAGLTQANTQVETPSLCRTPKLLGFQSKFLEQVLATGHRRAVQTLGTAQAPRMETPGRPLRAARIFAQRPPTNGQVFILMTPRQVVP